MPQSEKQRVKRKKIQRKAKQDNGQPKHVHSYMCQHTGVRFYREEDLVPTVPRRNPKLLQ